jgi:histidinol phosphatase-like PHP family hydrolase
VLDPSGPAWLPAALRAGLTGSRFFLHDRRRGRRRPAELYGDLADMLAATGTAAEMNLHNSYPDVAFFAECIRRGVKVALASDAHELWEVALLGAHVEMLRQAAGMRDICDLLLG